MSGNSLINAYYHQNKIYHKYISPDGTRHFEATNYEPTLGYMVKEETGWKDLAGNNLKVLQFPNMSEASKWKKENSGLLDIYGDIQYPIAFIGENYPDEIEVRKSKFNIYDFDIEAFSLDTEETPEPIRSITFQNMNTNIFYVFAYAEGFTPFADNIRYFKCKDETHLLRSIVDFFVRQDIDIITGWNIDGYDVGYTYNRIKKILGEDEANKLSPIKKIVRSEKMVNKKMQTVYRIEGIISWDYQTLYKKFTKDLRESYSLNFISQFELGEEKTSYKEEYDTLEGLYNKNFQLFMEYNIRDCQLIYLLDEKLKYIDNAIMYFYMAKCEPQNIFGTTKPWDSLIYCELLKENILCPPNKTSHKEDFEGGYVKEPIRGFRKWVSVDDIISSYPNQICGSNMSPETVLSESEVNDELKQIRETYTGVVKCLDIDSLEQISEVLRKHNVTYTSNGHFFSKKKQGFIPKIVSRLFQRRIATKKLMKDPNIDKAMMSVLDNLQYTLKIFLNSIYGAMASHHFRYYDIRIATAITWQGQLCARGAATYLMKHVQDIEWDYQDTDSIFINLNGIVTKRFGEKEPDKETVAKFLIKYHDKVIEPTINTFFDKLNKNLNMFAFSLEMEFEGLSNAVIFVEKKKYCMSQIYCDGKWYLDKPKMKIKGIEVVRTSTPYVVREKIRETLNLIFQTGDNKILIDFIEEFRKEFYKMSFEEVGMPRGINLYGNRRDKQTGTTSTVLHTLGRKGIPIQVRAALIYNKALKDFKLEKKYPVIENGDKIKFAYIKKPNYIQSDIVGCLEKMPKELLPKFEIDYPVMFQKTFMAPLEKIFSTIGYDTETRVDLSEFF